MKTGYFPAVLVACAFSLWAPAPAPAAIDATGKITVSLKSSAFNAGSATTTNTYLLKNTSTAAYTGPFMVVLESLDNRDVAILNPDGYTPEGNPYFEYQKASLAPLAKTPGKPWLLHHRCGKKVTATVKAFDAAWQIAPPAACSPLATLHVSVLASDGGANHAPVAEAGPDQTVKAGTVIPLDGSGSTDEDGDPLTYRWSVVSKPAGGRAILSGAATVRPTVKLTLAGTYVLGLTVKDWGLASARDTCTLTTVNSRPVADAGADQTVPPGTVRLDGSRSADADGDRLGYAWSIVAKPPGSTAALANATTVRPTFKAVLAGEYVLQLVVSHGTKRSFPAFCRISTVNSLPTAAAGGEQKVAPGDTVRLDGSGSSDVDGDPLAYRWALLSKPKGSAAAIAEPAAVRASFVADFAGTYVAQLMVNDGQRDSVPGTVVVTTVNARPVADAGSDRTAGAGALVRLDGRGSRDADGAALSRKWSFLSVPRGSRARLLLPTSARSSFRVDKAGTYVVQLAVSDGTLKGLPDTVVVDAKNSRPVAGAGPDQDVHANRTVQLDGSGSRDADGDALTPFWAMLLRPPGSAAALVDPAALSPDFLADLPGTYVLQLIVGDDSLASDPDTVAISATIRVVAVPDVVGLGEDPARAAIASADLVVGAVSRVDDDLVPPGSVISQNPSGGTSVAEGTAVDLVISLGPPPLPPDPASVAPPIDPTVATILADATRFLYTGPDPIQRGVAPGTIEPQRAAVIRGTVSTRDGLPLPGVRITILDHPEFGRTLSRLDGMFDLAVNGGGSLTVNYAKKGYLPVQRQVDVPWQDYVWAPDVVLIPLDSKATFIDLTAAGTFQVAQGPVVTDSRGTRQSTLLFPQGTQAEFQMPDGTTRPASNLTVRATEYTVGDSGPEAMPGDLPLGIGYTYAVELSVDEALAAGADQVRFSQAVVNYLENFPGLEVGSGVPAYFFDRKRGLWVPMPNGRIVKVLSVTAGLADLDVDGDDGPDTGSKLADLGITDAERGQLVGLYSAGQGLWRVPLRHFSPIDYNYPRYLEDPLQNPREIEVEENDDDPCNESGASVIECQNQKLMEGVAVTGTPYTLNYQSGRASGRLASDTLTIPLTGPALREQAFFLGVELRIRVAGRRFSYSYPPAPDLSHTFVWDGVDAYGRSPQGAQPVRVSMGYTYVGRRCVRAGRCGWQPGTEDTYWRDWWGTVGHWDHGRVLGGWSLSVHHGYDPVAKTLYLGTGEQRSAVNQGVVVDTVAGNGTFCSNYAQPCGDGGRATDARLYPWGVDVGPDGSLYVTDEDAGRIWRARPDGTIAVVAGLKSAHYWCDNATDPCGDGGPATEARFGDIYQSSVGQDGSIYVADVGINRIRKVGPDGVIATVAGTGERGFAGDGGPATLAKLNQPYSARMAPDGNLYIADTYNRRIRRVGPDGIIATVAGNGNYCDSNTAPCGDGGLATEAPVGSVTDLAVGKDGSIYIPFGYRIRKVSPDGIITTIAGTGDGWHGGDGGPALDAQLKLLGLTLAPDGSLVFANGENAVRRIDPAGIITTVAGNAGPFGYGGDNGPATRARFWRPWYTAVGPNGHIYVADAGNKRLRRVRPLLPGYTNEDVLITSGDGSELYVFDPTGRHLRTLSTVTGAALYEFAYDAQGRLIQVRDVDDNVTNVERDSSGIPTAITGPYGQHTAFALDDGGRLGGITNPAGEITAFEYTSNGLMTRRVSPRGHSSTFTYDPAGRLTRDENAVGGYQALVRNEFTGGHEVTRTTALGRATTYRVERLPTGDKLSANTFPDGLRSTSLAKADGSQTITEPDGTVTTVQQGPDPRFGMQAPIPGLVTITTPAGLAYSGTTARSVTLADPADPFSLVTRTDTLVVNGRTHQSQYTAATRQRVSTTPQGRQTVTTFDARGRVVKKERAGIEPVSLTYDAAGRLTKIAQGPAGSARETTFVYDADGNVASLTDPLGRAVSFEHDGAGRVTRQVLPDGAQLLYGYDAAGNLASLVPPGRPQHGFGYNPVDVLAQYAPPPVGGGPTATMYAYNLDRQLTGVTRPGGGTIALAHDSAGRLSSRTIQRGTIGYAYAAQTGRISSITAPGGGRLSFTHDGSLLTGVTWEGEVQGSLTLTYNNDFRPASLGVSGGSTVGFAYDGDGLLTQAGALGLSRNPANGLLTGTSLGVVTDTLLYSTFGELSDYSASANSAEIFRVQFTRDGLGRITAKTETISGVPETYAYTYDLAGRLAAVRKGGSPVATYSYDANGNRLTADAGTPTTATYDDQDRLLQYGSATYGYTDNGELATKTVGAQSTTYQYDELGNLMTVVLPDARRIDYVIDGRNRRIGKKVDGVLTQGLLYRDRLSPVAELDGAGAMISQFVYGTRSNVPDYILRGGATYRVISDHLGSVRLVVDAATGGVAQRMDYDAFGNVVGDTSPGFQPFGFAGGLYDRDTGLTRFGIRDYDAVTGRWTAKDPLGFLGGDANLYGYVLGDPVNMIDSSGAVPPVVVIIAANPATWAAAAELVDFGICALDINTGRGPGPDFGQGPGAAAGTAARQGVTQMARAASEAARLYEAEQQLEAQRASNTEQIHELSREIIEELEQMLEEMRRERCDQEGTCEGG